MSGFKLMGPKRASRLGAYLGGVIGPKLAATRKADRHMALALPEYSAQQRQQILHGMWRNLGALLAEYPHLEALGSVQYTRIINEEIALELYAREKPAIFFSAHLGNWEINCPAMLIQHGKSADLTYRAPNNPWVDRMLGKARTLGGKLRAWPKSSEGGRQIMRALKEGHYLGILIDQKYNEGVNVPFFGHDAMTNPVFVQLAQKFKYPLVPIRNIRRGPDQSYGFDLHVYPALDLFDEQGAPLPVEQVIAKAHELLEEWIKEKPEQWIWLHKRWKDTPNKSF